MSTIPLKNYADYTENEYLNYICNVDTLENPIEPLLDIPLNDLTWVVGRIQFFLFMLHPVMEREYADEEYKKRFKKMTLLQMHGQYPRSFRREDGTIDYIYVRDWDTDFQDNIMEGVSKIMPEMINLHKDAGYRFNTITIVNELGNVESGTSTSFLTNGDIVKRVIPKTDPDYKSFITEYKVEEAGGVYYARGYKPSGVTTLPVDEESLYIGISIRRDAQILIRASIGSSYTRLTV
jgi:hypothetical protein